MKAADSSSNPYLALGGLIAAGLDGVRRELTVGAPALVDPGNFSEEERVERGILRFPTSQAAALDALEADSILMEALGPVLANAYITVKRSEYAAFSAEDIDFEIKHHIYKF